MNKDAGGQFALCIMAKLLQTATWLHTLQTEYKWQMHDTE